jgi:hypothetical protein
MTQSPLAGVESAQRLWAAQAGLSVDERGYLPDVAQNLFGGLSDEVRAAFEQADGAELKDREGGPAKMRSVISSSALAVNVFQHWALNDPAPVGRALGLSAAVTKIEFEGRMPTGAGGTPPNLDVVITTADGGIVGIESKFTEWMKPSTKYGANLEPYFRSDFSLWASAGLASCDRLAKAVHDGSERFAYLNVPQLLKHALGLNRAKPGAWSLYYLWYDADGDAGLRHRDEVDRFAQEVGQELRFRAISYQAFLREFFVSPDLDAYFEYLRRRYALGLIEV